MESKLIDVTLGQVLLILGVWTICIPVAIIILFNLFLIIRAFIKDFMAKKKNRRANP